MLCRKSVGELDDGSDNPASPAVFFRLIARTLNGPPAAASSVRPDPNRFATRGREPYNQGWILTLLGPPTEATPMSSDEGSITRCKFRSHTFRWGS